MESLASLGLGWPDLLSALMRGEDLDGDTAGAALAEILKGDAATAEIAAFITLIHAKGETVEELLGLVRTMLAFAEPLPLHHDVLDTCGTGGTRQRQRGGFNVSTLSAIVIAGCGVKVAKHGGRAVSSTSGSADLLEAMGVAIELDGRAVSRCVDEAGIGFCFAPLFHPAARHAGPVRRQLRVSSVFNIINPLSNPARPAFQVIGAGTPALAELAAEVLGRNGAARVIAVSGHDGLDELTLTGPTHLFEWRDGHLLRSVVTPGDVGLAVRSEGEVTGGDASTNVHLAQRVLEGEPGAHRDAVLLNAAAGLLVSGVVEDLKSGVDQAATAIDRGFASDSLERLVVASNSAAEQ